MRRTIISCVQTHIALLIRWPDCPRILHEDDFDKTGNRYIPKLSQNETFV